MLPAADTPQPLQSSHTLGWYARQADTSPAQLSTKLNSNNKTRSHATVDEQHCLCTDPIAFVVTMQQQVQELFETSLNSVTHTWCSGAKQAHLSITAWQASS
jgi:hypothetical protein